MSQVGPKYLYRYRHLQGKHCKYTSRILTDSVLFFASPTSFNDPFDCKVHFQPSIPLKELRQTFMEELRLNPHSERADRRAEVKQLLKVDRNDLLVGITDLLQQDVDRLGVLSLSASYRDVLLWSHYAAGHSGLCLKFLATDSTLFFGRARRVEYLPEYPKVDLLRDSKEHRRKSFLLTKAADWCYEKEWRIFDTNGPGERLFPEELLVGVILGALMSPEDKKYVVSLIGKRNFPVKIYQASVSKGSFSLDIEAYEP